MVPWILEGGDNFYLAPPWQDAINAALARDVGPSVHYAESHRIALYEAHWAALVRDMKALGQNEDKEQALRLYKRVAPLASELSSAAHPVFEKAFKSGMLAVRSDPSAIGGEKYVIGDYFVFRTIGFYSQCAIVLNRMMKRLVHLLGYPETGLDADNRDYCRHIWLLIPYLQSLGPMATHLSTLNIMLSWSGGNTKEKDLVVEHLLAVATVLNNLPREKPGMEDLIRKIIGAFTGGCE